MTQRHQELISNGIYNHHFITNEQVRRCTDQPPLTISSGIYNHHFITNEQVRRSTDQPPLTHIIRLKFFNHIHVLIHPGTTVEPLVPVWFLCQGTEPPIRPTVSHLATDCWMWFSTTQHWSGNHLSSSKESSSLEHDCRNSNVQNQTSHTMMTSVFAAVFPLDLR